MDFLHAHASDSNWTVAADECLAQLDKTPPGPNPIAFLYVSDHFTAHLGELLDHLKQTTGIAHWVGSVAIGICGSATEYSDEGAISILVCDFPEDSVRVFSSFVPGDDSFRKEHGEWIDTHQPYLAIVHADPDAVNLENTLNDLIAQTGGCFLVGGLPGSRNAYLTIADSVQASEVSGLLVSSDVPVLTRLSQGCAPISKRHRVTEVHDHVLYRLDGQRALDVFNADIGDRLAEQLGSLGGYIFAGLPLAQSDTNEYLVRSLIGFDPEHGLLAVGADIGLGDSIMFCRRDRDSAERDLEQMLAQIRHGLSGQAPRGALYFSCLGRGENLFGANSAELKIIEDALGPVPLAGFFANGEIYRDSIYGYTGVLLVFY